MRADGRTDMTKLVVAFRNFVNAKKIYNSKNSRTIVQMAVVTTCTIWCYIFELRFATRRSFVVILTINIID